MKRVIRRMVLSAAALSPGVVAITVHEMALSIFLMLMGVAGLLCAAAVTLAVSPKVNESLARYDTPNTGYPSLLLAGAFDFLASHSPDPLTIRARLHGLVTPDRTGEGFLTPDDQIAMILSQVMARWGEMDLYRLTDEQARELWLVERILRASPAEAGALAGYFAAPDAVLAMRDQVANSVAA